MDRKGLRSLSILPKAKRNPLVGYSGDYCIWNEATDFGLEELLPSEGENSIAFSRSYYPLKGRIVSPFRGATSLYGD
jgi:hypothetical protein